MPGKGATPGACDNDFFTTTENPDFTAARYFWYGCAVELDMNPIPQPPVPDLLMPWWFDLLIWLPAVVLVLSMVWIWRKANSSEGVLSKQAAYLEHQKATNDQALAQQKAMEHLIARQYAENSRRADEALAQAAEALRLQSAALEQLTAINAALSRAVVRGAEGGRA